MQLRPEEQLRRDVQKGFIQGGHAWQPAWDAVFAALPLLYPEVVDLTGPRYGQPSLVSPYEAVKLRQEVVELLLNDLEVGEIDPIASIYSSFIGHLPFVETWIDPGPDFLDQSQVVTPPPLYLLLTSYYQRYDSSLLRSPPLARLVYYWFYELYLFQDRYKYLLSVPIEVGHDPELERKALLALIAVGRHAYLPNLPPLPALGITTDLDVAEALGLVPETPRTWPTAEELASSADWRQQVVGHISKELPPMTLSEYVEFIRSELLADIYRPGGALVLERRTKTEAELGLVSPACGQVARERILTAVYELLRLSAVDVLCEVISRYSQPAGLPKPQIEPCLEHDRYRLLVAAYRIIELLTRESLCAIVREYGSRIGYRVDGVEAEKF